MYEIIVDILKMIFRIINCGLSCMIIKRYFSSFLKNSKVSALVRLLWCTYILWQIVFSESLVIPPFLKVLINICIISLICIIGYKGRILQKVFLSVLLTVSWMLMEFIIGEIFSFNGVDYILYQELGEFFSNVLTLIFISILSFFSNSQELYRKIKRKYNIMLLIITIGSAFVAYVVFMIGQKEESYMSLIVTTICIVILLGINILSYYLYDCLSKESVILRENSVYVQQLELCSRMNDEKESMMLEFKQLKHDLKNHYTVLYEILLNGDRTEAIEYLNEIFKKPMSINTKIIDTGNIVVDALINSKCKLAKENNIKLNANILLPAQMPFLNADISILLGNIMDNAIEASLKLKEDVRLIELFMRYEKGILHIVCKNSFDGIIKRNREGNIQSTKKDYTNHGFGLVSVKMIVDKYRGNLSVDSDNNIFMVTVMLIK